MSSALIAPGMVLGRYPERAETEQGRIEQLLERCCQHLTRRIDRQLFGRCGRQGDPGSYQSMVSFEDGLVMDFYGPRGGAALARLLCWSIAPLPLLARCTMRFPQWALEQRHRGMRKVFQKMDDHLETLLSFSGQQR